MDTVLIEKITKTLMKYCLIYVVICILNRFYAIHSLKSNQNTFNMKKKFQIYINRFCLAASILSCTAFHIDNI